MITAQMAALVQPGVSQVVGLLNFGIARPADIVACRFALSLPSSKMLQIVAYSRL